MKLPWNWRQRLAITKETDRYRFRGKTRVTHTYRLQFVEGTTPRGCFRHVGYLQVCDGFVEDAQIAARFRGKGLGKLLYETALKELGSLATAYHSGSVSEAARRVWQGLCRRHVYKSDFWNGSLTVFNGRGQK